MPRPIAVFEGGQSLERVVTVSTKGESSSDGALADAVGPVLDVQGRLGERDLGAVKVVAVHDSDAKRFARSLSIC